MTTRDNGCRWSDYNECHATGMCTNGHCVNLDGGFRCICDVGFTLAEGGEVCIGEFCHFTAALLALSYGEMVKCTILLFGVSGLLI